MTAPSDLARLAARLSHDVGKYVARTAHNVPASRVVPEPLVDMLLKDLFELDRGRRASSVFEEGARPIEERRPDPRLVEVRALLGELDAMEADMRAHVPEALSRAVAIALEVEALLRGLAVDLERSEP